MLMCPLVFAAPEVLHTMRRKYDGKPADVWSCGVVLFPMLFCRFPFDPREGDVEKDRQSNMMRDSDCNSQIIQHVDARQRSEQIKQTVHAAIQADCACSNTSRIHHLN